MVELSSAVIMFRETLEAALVVGITLAFLLKAGYLRFSKFVGLGVAAGVGASIAAAVFFQLIAGDFEGRAEQLFEGSTMLLAAILLSWMIVWMLRRGMHLKGHTESRVSKAASRGEKLELFLLAFIAVFREGVESVIYLGAAAFAGSRHVLLTGAAGVVAALLVSVAFFTVAKNINLRHFFTATSILLMLFAAGLMSHSVHEFQEAGVVPMTVEHVWDTSHVLSEASVGGSLASSLFGYASSPSLLEVAAYAAYLIVAGVAFFSARRLPVRAAAESH